METLVISWTVKIQSITYVWQYFALSFHTLNILGHCVKHMAIRPWHYQEVWFVVFGFPLKPFKTCWVLCFTLLSFSVWP